MWFCLLGILVVLALFLPPIKDALEKIGAELMKLRQLAEDNRRDNLGR